MRKLTKPEIITVASIAIALITLAMVTIVPFVVQRGILGTTFLSNPSFSIKAVELSKNGTNCQILTVIENTGNLYIAMLTLTLNQTHVWDDAWIGPDHAASDRQLFENYGDLHCTDMRLGQTYTAIFLANFADGEKQTRVTTVQVQPYPIFYW